MERTEQEVAQIHDYLEGRHLLGDRKQNIGGVQFKPADPKNFHFFNYDPTLGPTDLSNVSVKRDNNHDTAVFSIPLSFTESSKTKYNSHTNRDLGLDIQAYMTPHNAPIYPLRK